MEMFNSPLSPLISSFIQEKQASGYDYKTGTSLMRQFDRYWSEHGFQEQTLTFDNISEWLELREGESSGGCINRISVVREFSCFLNGLGIQSYIPPIEIDKKIPIVHIFSKPEISDLFSQIDRYRPKTKNKDHMRMSDEYPVLFRLIYLNGMRISEACNLSTSNIDLEKGIITILNGKGNKDRLIYLADDMRQLCKDYLNYLAKVTGEYPQWVFPGISTDSPINIVTAELRFNDCWKNTSYADSRHTFVVNKINQWIREGLSFKQMLPYLSKYLGHRSFNETYYYYHYVEESAEAIRSSDKTIGKVIPEVMRR